MRIDDETCYRALAARDARFDGLFFRWSDEHRDLLPPDLHCPYGGPCRCRFFSNSALAEREGFRPCLRCRPELAPGHAPVDAVRERPGRPLAGSRPVCLNNGGDLERLADDLGLSTRQLRRAVKQEFGVSPVELAQTQRLLLAKQLLTESDLPVIQVAFASGFESVRRFNALFHSHYRLTPSRMRRASTTSHAGDSSGSRWLTVLPWRGTSLALPRGTGDCRCRIGRRSGLPPDSRRRQSSGLAQGQADRRTELPVGRAGDVAHPGLTGGPRPLETPLRSECEAGRDCSSPLGRFSAPRVVARCPGLRVPGAFDGFELAVRAVLGQRISVRAATTLAGRLAHRFGEPIETPVPGLTV